MMRSCAQVCWLRGAATCALLVLALGCDLDTAGPPVTAKERTPQPAVNPLEARASLSKAEAEPGRDASSQAGASYATSDRQVPNRQRNTSLPGAPNQGREERDGGNRSGADRTERVDCVKLSAGVALPQLLPTGTAIGLSVDYEIVRPLPTSAQQVMWVIEAGGNRRVEFPVRLDQQRGNLMTFAPELKPEHGPFRCHFEVVMPDGARQIISPTAAMKH